MAKPKDNKETQAQDKNEKKTIDIETKDSKNTEKTPDVSGGQQDAQSGAQSEAAPASEPTAEESLALEKDKYLRLAAEYDNFRKRTAKERESIYSSAKADVVAKLLPVYDNLERALKTECSDEAYYKGIEMTMTQLTEILSNIGIATIPTVGEAFDPNLHDAVARIDNPELESGTIAEECKKGFIMGERVIRFSSVVVAN